MAFGKFAVLAIQGRGLAVLLEPLPNVTEMRAEF